MKLGIVGNGGIVVSALESLKDTDIEVTALWCRNADKGAPLKEKYGIPALYTDYAEFLQSQDFDTVYIGLINSLHYEYTKKALQAGKHVICEKPFTVTRAEAKELYMIAMDRDVLLFEAIMSRYSANYDALEKNLHKVGDVKIVRCSYSQYSRRFDAYLEGKVLPAFDPKLAGGALMDINVYCLHFVTGLFGKPEKVTYYANKGFNGVDTSGVIILEYNGFTAVCTGAKDSFAENGAVIQGTKGTITMKSRPGVIKELTYTDLEGNTEVLDAAQEENPMRQEFLVIRDMIGRMDAKKSHEWMLKSLLVMQVIEDARTSAGIRL
ncbi:MAG: Gfo/Idh/MocA family oxidoreductase [Solobacterium sp.]|nr:Gfo/Idh/MocA family oxidoreductase [Solobacterium sp.]